LVLRVLVVEDEEVVRAELVHLLESITGVEVVGQAATAGEALEGIRSLAPDAVFVDVRLPGLDGMELAHTIREMANPPLVVFSTAYPDYAVDAFAVGAADYLLKPYTAERVRRTVHRLRALLGGAGEGAKATVRDAVAVPRSRGWILVPKDQICWLQVRLGGVHLHTTGGACYLMPGTLSEYEARLGEPFFRAHRHLLVNLRHVAEVVRQDNGNLYLVMNDPRKAKLPVSRHRSQELRRKLALEG